MRRPWWGPETSWASPSRVPVSVTSQPQQFQGRSSGWPSQPRWGQACEALPPPLGSTVPGHSCVQAQVREPGQMWPNRAALGGRAAGSLEGDQGSAATWGKELRAFVRPQRVRELHSLVLNVELNICQWLPIVPQPGRKHHHHHAC